MAPRRASQNTPVAPERGHMRQTKESTLLGLLTAVLCGLSIAACLEGPRLDHEDYERSCAAHEECRLYELDGVCSRCATVPVAEPDWARAEGAIAAVRWLCIPGMSCRSGLVAQCLSGECEAVPYEESDGGMPY